MKRSKIKRKLNKMPVLSFVILWYVAAFFIFPIMILDKIDSFDNFLGWVMFFIFMFGIYVAMVFYKRITNSK